MGGRSYLFACAALHTCIGPATVPCCRLTGYETVRQSDRAGTQVRRYGTPCTVQQR